MKIAKVVGKLSLKKAHPSLIGRKWIVAAPLTLRSLDGRGDGGEEEIVAVDDLGVTQGCLVGISDGREACAPYEPHRKPVDAYTSCLLDEVRVDRTEVARLLGA
jgi:microcompartment protein CcmK/EutM